MLPGDFNLDVPTRHRPYLEGVRTNGGGRADGDIPQRRHDDGEDAHAIERARVVKREDHEMRGVAVGAYSSSVCRVATWDKSLVAQSCSEGQWRGEVRRPASKVHGGDFDITPEEIEVCFDEFGADDNVALGRIEAPDENLLVDVGGWRLGLHRYVDVRILSEPPASKEGNSGVPVV